MTKIDAMKQIYYQKSKLFLYPLLGIKRGGPITPIKTFFRWEGKYTTIDRRLIVLYKTDETEEFKEFDKSILRANPFFDCFHAISPRLGAYVFHFKDYESYDVYGRIITGKYSELTETFKNKIINFYKPTKGHVELMKNYLYPSRFYEDYANTFVLPTPRNNGASEKSNIEKMMRKTGEVCSIPNIQKETLSRIVNDLDFIKE